MDFFLTLKSKCHVQCSFCPYQDLNDDAEAKDVFDRIEKINFLNINRLVITGGDLLSNKNFIPLLKRLNSKNYLPETYAYTPLYGSNFLVSGDLKSNGRFETTVKNLKKFKFFKGFIIPFIHWKTGFNKSYVKSVPPIKEVVKRCIYLHSLKFTVIPLIYIHYYNKKEFFTLTKLILKYLSPQELWIRFFPVNDNLALSFQYQEISDDLKKLHDYLKDRGIKPFLVGDEYPPPCIDNLYYDAPQLYETALKERKKSVKITSKCNECDLSSLCNWNYKRYFIHFNTSSFHPLKLQRKAEKNVKEFTPSLNIQNYRWFYLKKDISVACTRPWTNMEIMGIINDPPLVSSCNEDWIKLKPEHLKDYSIVKTWNGKYYKKLRTSIINNRINQVCHSHCTIYNKQKSEPVKDEKVFIEGKSAPFLTNSVINLKEIIEKKVVLQSFPRYLAFGPTYRCNHSCVMCHSVPKRKKGIRAELGEWFYEELKKYLPFLKELNISGPGEPLISKPFRDFLLNTPWNNYPNIEITVTTNGSILTPAMIDRFFRIPFKGFIVSLNAASLKTYKHVTGENHFRTVIRNIKYLRKNLNKFTHKKPFLQLSFVVMRSNFRELPAFLKIVEKLDTGLILVPVETKSINKKAYKESFLYHEKDFKEAIALIDALIERYKKNKLFYQYLLTLKISLKKQREN